MPPRGSSVLVDTVAIKAAHDLGCWNALRKNFQLVTVEKCVEEATRVNRDGFRLVDREADALTDEIKVHTVTDVQRAIVQLQVGRKVDLHAGERDLLAYALTLGRQSWWLCGPDKATLIALHKLTLLERMVALESLARAVGHKMPSLEEQYTESWLKTKRTKLLLGEERI